MAINGVISQSTDTPYTAALETALQEALDRIGAIESLVKK